MRLHGPVSFKIEQVQSNRLQLKTEAGFYLDISGQSDDERPYDYYANDSLVCVDILLGAVGNPDHRQMLSFPGRLSAKNVPGGVFDCKTFVEELDCDIGLLFSAVAARSSTIKITLGKGKQAKVTITLTIGEDYSSEIVASRKQLKPFLKKAR